MGIYFLWAIFYLPQYRHYYESLPSERVESFWQDIVVNVSIEPPRISAPNDSVPSEWINGEKMECIESVRCAAARRFVGPLFD